ncbi:MAG: HAMP domain-containing histidine kinase [Clostridia bacterium]|nr:HAMP domain-containing histidine kinase [Clostridia bacterium]
MKKSLRTKVIAVFLVSVVMCMLLLNLLCGFCLRYIFIYDTRKAMVSYSEMIENDMQNGSRNMVSILRGLNDSYAVTASAVDRDANVFFSHRHLIDDEVKQSYKRWMALYEIKKHTKSDSEYYFQKEKDDEGSVDKLIFVTKTKQDIFLIMTKEIKGIDQDIRVVSILLSAMSIIIAAIGTVVWSIATRPFTTQIEKMSRITNKMAKLNFEEKINYSSDDEVGILARSIDSMSDELKESIENLKEDLEKRKCTLRDLAHEIKTPITTIRGYTESIEYFCKDNEKVQRYCNIMLDECDEVTALINEMLMMSLLESDEYIQQSENISISRLQHELMIRIENEFADAGIKADFEAAELFCNADLIERALLNFVSNAVKYGEKDKEIILTGKNEKDRYVFSVSNYGAEINGEEQRKIWEAFYKNDKSRKRGGGHGLGLSIVSRIAKSHGGDVDLKSEEGINTFIMWIPLM